MSYSGVSKHVKRWNYWRKRSKDPMLYKLAVLFGIKKSQAMTLTIPISLQHRYKR